MSREIRIQKSTGKKYVEGLEGEMKVGDRVGDLYVVSVGGSWRRMSDFIFVQRFFLGGRPPTERQLTAKPLVDSEATQRKLDR